MFSYIKRVIGNVTVRENSGIITVEGIPGDVIRKDIKNIWETDRVNVNMFLHIDSSSFSFLSFYATDVLYTLEKLTDTDHSLKVSLHTLTKIKEKLLECTWLSRTLEVAPKILDRSKIKEFHLKPLSHQEEFFDVYERNLYCYNLKGMLLAAAAGSGKTVASLMLMEMLKLDAVIIVCPKPALGKVWEETVKSAFHKQQTYWITSSDQEPKGNEKFFIIHYEALSKMLEHAEFLKNKEVGIILDESHNLNELTSLRSNYFVDLCSITNSKNIVWLSGTPFKAVALESIPLLRTIDPLFTKEVELGFRKIYGKSNGRAVEILNNRLGLVSFKVEKKELNLQPPIFSDIKVKIPNSNDYTLTSIKKVMKAFIEDRQVYYADLEEQYKVSFYECLDYYRSTLTFKDEIKLYDLYRENLKKVINSGGDYSAKDEIIFCNRFESTKIIPSLPPTHKALFRDIKSVIKYVKLKIQGEALGRVFGGLRTQCHVDMVEKIDFKSICESTVKKTVIFTSFVQVIEKTKEFLENNQMKPLVVYGKTNSNLTTIISSFERDESLNPLIATYKSLSTAVPITCANVVILLDAPFRDYIKDQSISRLHRLGQDSQVYVYTCSLDTGEEMNISTRSFEILTACSEFVESLTGIKTPYEITGNPEELEFSLEGLDIGAIESVSIFKPNFINW